MEHVKLMMNFAPEHHGKRSQERKAKTKKNETKHSYSSLARSLAWHFDNNKLFNNSTIVPTVSPPPVLFRSPERGIGKIGIVPSQQAISPGIWVARRLDTKNFDGPQDSSDSSFSDLLWCF